MKRSFQAGANSSGAAPVISTSRHAATSAELAAVQTTVATRAGSMTIARSRHFGHPGETGWNHSSSAKAMLGGLLRAHSSVQTARAGGAVAARPLELRRNSPTRTRLYANAAASALM